MLYVGRGRGACARTLSPLSGASPRKRGIPIRDIGQRLPRVTRSQLSHSLHRHSTGTAGSEGWDDDEESSSAGGQVRGLVIGEMAPRDDWVYR